MVLFPPLPFASMMAPRRLVIRVVSLASVTT